MLSDDRETPTPNDALVSMSPAIDSRPAYVDNLLDARADSPPQNLWEDPLVDTPLRPFRRAAQPSQVQLNQPRGEWLSFQAT